MQRETKIGLAIVAIAIIGATSALVALRFIVQPSDGDQNNPTVKFSIHITDESTSVTLTSNQIENMSFIEANSSFQNRYGNWCSSGTYKGVLLSSLIELVGTMSSYDAIEVIATDNYNQYYSYDNLYPNASYLQLQGHLILAYEYNGTAIPNWDEGPRIVFLPDDEQYSVDDANKTTHPSWFDGTAGGRCVKLVETIKLHYGVYPPPMRMMTLVSSQKQLLPQSNILDSLFFKDACEFSLILYPALNEENRC
ncbi:MAG: hypothetical protein ACFFDP_06710 [Promethearchaeota archaeon]